MDGELVQVTVALGEIALSLNGLTFALLLSADAQIDGYRHTGIPPCVAASILRTTITTNKTRPLSQPPNQNTRQPPAILAFPALKRRSLRER
jgi:hypothetical protein